ncbi:MAG: 2-oxoacid:ferredoxin oxidoreductase subunit beta, partial [Chloroflexi bacterium]|nr:2-oxoacid:ferredoxin oxidoreductase subunit beta [Chloroflexota bacterium]
RPTWCPGCGNFAILNALKRALTELGLEPHQVILVTGIGQSGKTNDYMRITGFHGLHGRPLPVATGFKLANPKMKVIVGHGDGDGYGEGGNHLIHSVRRNIGLVDMVHNNQVYALTKGQFSPTTAQGVETPTSPAPEGVIERPLNAVALALSLGATFVARAASYDLRHMAELLKEALNHRGYALLEIMQVCVTFNRRMDNDYYREHVYNLQEEGHNTGDRAAALAKAWEFPGGERIPVGIFYQDESVPAYEELVLAIREKGLVEQPIRARPKEEYRRLVEEMLV